MIKELKRRARRCLRNQADLIIALPDIPHFISLIEESRMLAREILVDSRNRQMSPDNRARRVLSLFGEEEPEMWEDA